ncbi:MAG: hypothetical protein H0W15_07445 [Gemmatimonadales bacterium]|nr:hypothetical protein [Gemmatimonadales bacterium]
MKPGIASRALSWSSALTLIAAPAAAQLPSINAPAGALRIELGGAFFPTSEVWWDGMRQPLGTLIAPGNALDGGADPLVAEVDARLSAILGASAPANSLGRVSPIAEWQRGVGTIGLAYGVSRRITVFGSVPIVSVRTQVDLGIDSAGSTLGFNPSDPILGTTAGANQTATFFAEFDQALSELSTRVGRGDYAADPANEARAQALLATAPGVRAMLFELLADPQRSSPILPTAGSTSGMALLGRVAAVRGAFNDDFGIGFTASPALPTSPVTAEGFDALLDAGTAFGFTPRNGAPRVALGDVETGVLVEAFRREGERSMTAAWLRGAVRFPTGDAPDAGALLDQGTGDGQTDIEVGATVEVMRGRIGLRVEGNYVRQLAGELEARVGSPLQALLPARFRAAVSRDPGDIVALTARPFFRMAASLAIAGLVQYERRGSDMFEYVDGQDPIVGADVEALATGTRAAATRVGIGLSYSHDGRGRDGVLRMPVEASFSVERTVASSLGVVSAPTTSRVQFRIYKAIRRR